MTGLAWWQRGAVYQIYPRSFADANGDGVGDLAGIAEHLDHLAELAVEAIWLSPFFPSPMADFGYDVSDYCDVDPVFGTLDDFDRLVEACHARGIRMVIDWVPNHTSDRHAWFAGVALVARRPPARLVRLARPGARRRPAERLAVRVQGVRPGVDARRAHRPVLPALLHARAARPQLGQPGGRGRDARRPALLARPRAWTASASTRSPRSPRTRTCATTPAPRAATTRTGTASTTACAGSGACSTSTTTACWWGRSRCRTSTASSATSSPATSCTWRTTSSSSTCRGTPRRCGPRSTTSRRSPRTRRGRRGSSTTTTTRASPPASTTAATAPRARARSSSCSTRCAGRPFIFQGEELGLPDAEIPPDRVVDVDGRDPERAPIPWLPPSAAGPGAGFTSGEPWLPVVAEAETLNAETQAADPRSTLSLVRRLAALRASTPALQDGAQLPLDAGRDVLAWIREGDGDRWLAALNFATEPVSFAVDEHAATLARLDGPRPPGGLRRPPRHRARRQRGGAAAARLSARVRTRRGRRPCRAGTRPARCPCSRTTAGSRAPCR